MNEKQSEMNFLYKRVILEMSENQSTYKYTSADFVSTVSRQR